MKHRPGKHQRAILDAMQQGAVLFDQGGVWYTMHGDITRYVSGASCQGLFSYGYIFSDRQVHLLQGSSFRYALTLKGMEADCGTK